MADTGRRKHIGQFFRQAVDMVDEGLLSKEEAVLRVSPEQVDFFLHPQFDETARGEAQLIATGLNVSPGAAVGVVEIGRAHV